MTDCNLTQWLLSLGRRDRSADDEAALERHVLGCPTCSAAAAQVNGFDSAVAKAMVAVPVPAHFREKLLTTAAARRGEAWRRKAYQYSALAAGLLLAVGAAFAGHWRNRPVLDTAALVVSAEQDSEGREAAVKVWLAKQELPQDFPFGADLDFRLCVFHGKGELQGRDVPVVVFQNGTEQARLYVVREGQLNTADIRGEEGSVWKVAVARHPTAAGVSYVILYTNDLEQFRRKLIGPAA